MIEQWLFPRLESFFYYVASAAILAVFYAVVKIYSTNKLVENLQHLAKETNELARTNSLLIQKIEYKITELEKENTIIKTQITIIKTEMEIKISESNMKISESYKRMEFFEMLKRIELMLSDLAVKGGFDILFQRFLKLEIELQEKKFK